MKKLIILQSKKDTGKTHTLKKVIKELLDRKARLIDFSEIFAR